MRAGRWCSRMRLEFSFRGILIGGSLIWLSILAVIPYLILIAVSFLDKGGGKC